MKSIIGNLAGVVAWVDSQSGGVPWHTDERLARLALEDCATAVFRAANRAGVSWGDDWSPVLESFPVEELRSIASRSIASHSKRRR
jgi:hypothetical protein